MEKAIYLIPIDFSEVSTNAINFGASIAKNNDDEILLVHVISDESKRAETELKLEAIINQRDPSWKQNFSYKVVVGQVINDIGKIAEMANASLIIMGTHGEKGFQKVFGSHALRMISHSKVPFIIVQKESEYHEIDKIVMTIDLEKESIQVVKVAATLCEKFNAEVILVGGNHTDISLRQKVQLNMKLCLEYLKEHDVRASVELLERKGFEENLINYCRENDVDMIAATYYADTFHAFSEKFVQHLLENKLNIPVITVDSEATGVSSQYGFMSI